MTDLNFNFKIEHFQYFWFLSKILSIFLYFNLSMSLFLVNLNLDSAMKLNFLISIKYFLLLFVIIRIVFNFIRVKIFNHQNYFILIINQNYHHFHCYFYFLSFLHFLHLPNSLLYLILHYHYPLLSLLLLHLSHFFCLLIILLLLLILHIRHHFQLYEHHYYLISLLHHLLLSS